MSKNLYKRIMLIYKTNIGKKNIKLIQKIPHQLLYY